MIMMIMMMTPSPPHVLQLKASEPADQHCQPRLPALGQVTIDEAETGQLPAAGQQLEVEVREGGAAGPLLHLQVLQEGEPAIEN